MSFIYAGCISVVALTVLGILATTEELINEVRGRRVLLIPRPVPGPRPRRRGYAHARQLRG
jgi:hypothetical protein